MRVRSLGLVFGLAFFAILIGCGGGSTPPPVTPPSITTSITVDARHDWYRLQYNACGDGGTAPYTWTVTTGNLPAGLTLSTGGVISGTPSAAGTSNFTVQVADAEATPKTATAPLTLAISGGATVMITSTPPDGVVGIPYSSQLAASGGSLHIHGRVPAHCRPA